MLPLPSGDMKAALVRMGIVLAAYGLGVLLLLPALDALQRTLLLPPLFGTLARVGLLLGIPLALVLAWRYPDVGDGGT